MGVIIQIVVAAAYFATGWYAFTKGVIIAGIALVTLGISALLLTPIK